MINGPNKQYFVPSSPSFSSSCSHVLRRRRRRRMRREAVGWEGRTFAQALVVIKSVSQSTYPCVSFGETPPPLRSVPFGNASERRRGYISLPVSHQRFLLPFLPCCMCFAICPTLPCMRDRRAFSFLLPHFCLRRSRQVLELLSCVIPFSHS